MTQLGGHAIFLDADKTQVAHGESPKDMGIILSRYGEGLAIRHDLAPYEGNAWMREIANWADIPMINLQCDVDHPTQTLADLMTLRENRGENLRGLQVGDVVGIRAVVCEAAVGAAGHRHAAAAVRDGRRPRPPPGVRADAGSDRAGRGGGGGGGRDHLVHRRHGRGVPRGRRRLPQVVGQAGRVHGRGQGARRVRRVQRLDLRRAPDDDGGSPMRSTCTACRPTAARRSPTR